MRGILLTKVFLFVIQSFFLPLISFSPSCNKIKCTPKCSSDSNLKFEFYACKCLHKYAANILVYMLRRNKLCLHLRTLISQEAGKIKRQKNIAVKIEIYTNQVGQGDTAGREKKSKWGRYGMKLLASKSFMIIRAFFFYILSLSSFFCYTKGVVC